MDSQQGAPRVPEEGCEPWGLGCRGWALYRLSSPSMYSFFFLRLSWADCLFLIFRRIFFRTRSSYWGTWGGGSGPLGPGHPWSLCSSQVWWDPPW